MADIAFLGLGRMGAPMAGRLVAAGHHVTVWNRTAARAGPLVEAGARSAGTPAGAVAGRGLVITMLADPAAVDGVLFGPDGAADALADGATLIEMSTIGPTALAGLRAKLRPSVHLVDAPVKGSVPAATAGELEIYLGGDEADAAACAEPLGVLGHVTHVGPLGTGAAIKLLVNCVTITSFALAGEVLALADRLGVETPATLDALAGTAIAPLVGRIRARLADPDAPTEFALRLAEKDLTLALDHIAVDNSAVDHGVPDHSAPGRGSAGRGARDGGAVGEVDGDAVGEAGGGIGGGVIGGAHERLVAAQRDGLGDRDISAVLGYLRRGA